MTDWFAIVGARSDDKQRALDQVVACLQSQLRLAGFFQERVHDDAGEVSGWDVVRVGGSGREVLARRSPNPELCAYSFEVGGFGAARSWAQQDADVVLVGGMGKLEAAGGGHFPVVQALIEAPDAPALLLCIRDTSLANIALRLPDPAGFIHLPCEASELDDFCNAILERCTMRASLARG
ncbi:MAG: hypothetical protein R3B13_03570 [Polyangiaceae bacterium]